MQTQEKNHRYRGYRESAPLVEGVKASACDLKKLMSDANVASVNYDYLRSIIDTLVDTRVSRLQHLRVQLRHRIPIATSPGP